MFQHPRCLTGPLSGLQFTYLHSEMVGQGLFMKLEFLLSHV